MGTHLCTLLIAGLCGVASQNPAPQKHRYALKPVGKHSAWLPVSHKLVPSSHGCGVGAGVGEGVGSTVGALVGVAVGVAVGEGVGAAVTSRHSCTVVVLRGELSQ